MAVGRFQVMAVLQAARAHALGLPTSTAYSWGLNRAIFIAAAKRGFKGRSGGTAAGSPGDRFALGDTEAYKVERGGVTLFTIGGEVQTPEEFDRRVKTKFGRAFSSAWSEAVEHVRKFDRETLLSGDGFYREVYRPVRDQLAAKWSDASD